MHRVGDAQEIFVILGPPQAEPGIHFQVAGDRDSLEFSTKIEMDPGSSLRDVQDDERDVCQRGVAMCLAGHTSDPLPSLFDPACVPVRRDRGLRSDSR